MAAAWLAVCRARFEEDYGSRPHIVILLADNVGWASVGFHRPPELPAREVHTPNIDALAAEGMELARAYWYKFCSPSRSALLSGRLPFHVNTFNDDPTMVGQGIPVGMTLMPEVLKRAGYATHFVGKWHVGMASRSKQIPVARGFDSSLGYFHSNNNYYDSRRGQGCGVAVDLWDGEAPSRLNGTDYEERFFCDRTVKIVREHDPASPLFAYHAFHTSCVGWNATTDDLNLQPAWDWYAKFPFIDDDDRRKNVAMVALMDACVGRIVGELKATGLWARSLVVWSSDNGGAVHAGGGSNVYPLKGGYFNNWEGGIRAPALLAGGFLSMSKIRTPAVLEGFVHAADWLSTFAYLAGVDPTDEAARAAGLPPIDSLNVWPLITGANRTSPRVEWPLTPLSERFGEEHTELVGGDAAYMLAPYKLIVGDKIAQANWCGQIHPNTSVLWDSVNDFTNCSWAPDEGKYGCLYDVVDDPTEHHDLAALMPEKAYELYTRLRDAQARFFDPDRGPPQEAACRLANTSGWWQPWLP
ncbi:hypothetical protein CTAYLR_008744 [Chrysophaeum taylorii]|uniref:Sulfatase N-terminal domain-containing protein n=1 Tax=Chrysophaeum taylorii TaxID=2483200 RepID=A0AAD7UK97_9STRA|nr:hypothetical protein CTAYLR_008744 [Chrysophaeum taylorii]